ncbi:spindle and kinetochore-associated protein 1 [Falco peregrinus]|uniref:spindle and kinetochore-associated protein 1 n=1 Tax=Falco peregrinus TaxID=8954 RepID=UPI0003871F07|nr:spindle and kinetochore-associated protein 1 [Falco peregrinus]XP_013159062.1 spindle and kinetochore-associated protein 1 [Falco peregrinus]
MEHRVSSGLEDLCLHINKKISKIKKTLILRRIGREPSLRSMFSKIGCEIILLHGLLNKMETEVEEQEKLKNLLKRLQKSAERDLRKALYLREHIPPHLPKLTRSCIAGLTVKFKEQTEVVKPKHAKKPTEEPRLAKKVPLVTVEEFESVPAYMKGRLTCDHVNAVVEAMNKAVVCKYKILDQPLKSVNGAVRKLYHRFLEEDTKDTKGAFFIVEADIKEFNQLKVDKRFYRIIDILRHCQRLREVRGSGLVRYVIC